MKRSGFLGFLALLPVVGPLVAKAKPEPEVVEVTKMPEYNIDNMRVPMYATTSMVSNFDPSIYEPMWVEKNIAHHADGSISSRKGLNK